MLLFIAYFIKCFGQFSVTITVKELVCNRNITFGKKYLFYPKCFFKF